jgi:phage shock protein PspC (stress-responsive transcriptional regulator)
MDLNSNSPIIAGICLQIAQHANVKPIWIRLGAFITAILFDVVAILIYLIFTILQ